MTELQHVASERPTAPEHSAAIRAHLERHRRALLELFETEGAAGLVLARRHAQVMDDLLIALHDAALAGLPPERACPPFSLGAVGGYGRELLGWRSDLDVWFVTEAAAHDILPAVEAILYPLWDAGISIGHQVLSVVDISETARTDLPTATGLLDFRRVAGDPAIAASLREHAYESVFNTAEMPLFIAKLEAEARGRHSRFGDSVYLLEPDVKNGTGGLRDIDRAWWAARARWHTQDPDALIELGVLSQRDADDVRMATNYLWTVRNHLHQHAGRRSDRLTFDEQETIAELMGYRSRVPLDAIVSDEQLQGAMVEAFMSDYYRYARVISRVCDQVIGRAKRRSGATDEAERVLGNGLLECSSGIGLCDPQQLMSDPALALRLYATASASELNVLGRARDAVIGATGDPAFCAVLRANTEAKRLFVQLVSITSRGHFQHGSVLAELLDVGLLVAMVPEFAPVVGRVHHDLYHVYTVDVHSVAAVDRLHALMRGDLADEHPLACALAARVTRPSMLCFATLLHDVGKAIGGKDHSQRGAIMARTILARLEFGPSDITDACQLIAQHLVMYRIAARRDLEDPTTIAELLDVVHGRDGLRDLYLLTVVDLSTTSPTSMTKWKSGILDSLYRRSDSRLSGRLPLDLERIAAVRAQVEDHWSSDADWDFLEEYLATMPARYLLSNAPSEIAAHARVAASLQHGPVSAALVPSRLPEIAELCVVTESRNDPGLFVVTADRPGLLASITAAITSNRLEIHGAQIHSRRMSDGGAQAVDLFWVRSVGGEESIEDVLPKLQRDLEQVLTGRVAAADLLKNKRARWSERPTPFVATSVVIDHQASVEHTVIEVSTKDRPGLLFSLAQVLHECGLSIAVAKISTEGSRASDVFYVTEAEGGKLAPTTRSQVVRDALLNSLGVTDAKTTRS